MFKLAKAAVLVVAARRHSSKRFTGIKKPGCPGFFVDAERFFVGWR